MVKKPTLTSIQNLAIDGASVSGGMVLGTGAEALYPQGQETVFQLLQTGGCWGLAASMKTQNNKLARSGKMMLIGAGAVPVIKAIKKGIAKLLPESIKNPAEQTAFSRFANAAVEVSSVAKLAGRYPLLASRSSVVADEWKSNPSFGYNTIDVEHEEYPLT
jgi:hypothetical protein